MVLSGFGATGFITVKLAQNELTVKGFDRKIRLYTNEFSQPAKEAQWHITGPQT